LSAFLFIMPRRFRISLGVLVALLITALATWCWYFATRPPQREVLMLRRVPVRPARPLRAATAGERAAAIRSIVAQLEAFKADRYELAARYQSRALKNNFRSTENFRDVIQRTYPQFAHYKSAKFGAARASQDGKLLEISILLTGQDGVQVKALYQMALEDGQYRVAGVNGGAKTASPPDSDETPPVPPGFEKAAPLLT
jgi:hypothetical protein